MKEQILIEQIESCIKLAEEAREELDAELEEIRTQTDRAWSLAEAYARALGKHEASVNTIKRYVDYYKEDNKHGNI